MVRPNPGAAALPAPVRTLRLLGAAVLSSLLLGSCAADVEGVGMSLNDPLALIDDVQGPLRAFVLPSLTYSCDATTGMVSPEVPDVAEGMFLDAVADVSISVVGGAASQELDVEAGSYIVLVRGKGTDPVTGRMNVFIATGCAEATIESGETRETRITLIPIVGSGMCGDGVLSPDEQCEDGGTSDGDGCSASCRTEPFSVSTTSGGVGPTVGGALGQRWASTYTVGSTDTFLRLLEPDGSAITTPSVLMADVDIDMVLPAGEQISSELQGAIAVNTDGRIALAFTDFEGGSTARVAFLAQNRVSEGGSQAAGSLGTSEPAIAFAGNGAAMVVFEDDASATGLSGRVFAAGEAMPSGTAFEVGAGATGAAAASIAGASDHFAVAFQGAGGVFLQRFADDGTARDASALMVSGSGSAAAVGAQADGRVLVAWAEGDDVRARAYPASGEPATAFVLNTTTAGAQGAPAIASADDRFGVAFQSGAGIRGRVLSGDGDPLPNRNQPPTTEDFELAPAGDAPAADVGGPTGTPTWVTVYRSGSDITARPYPLP